MHCLTKGSQEFLVITMKMSLKRQGRPRSFDREDAVRKAMLLFRRHGYEGVSLAMLTNAIGVAPPSLYAAFGNKAELYREALNRYSVEALLTLLPEDMPDLTLGEALDRMLRRAITLVACPTGERGCMISTGLLTSHPDHQGLTEELTARRVEMATRLATELKRWLSDIQATRAANFLCTVLQGIAVQARDGTSTDVLFDIATIARRGLMSEMDADTS